MKKESKTCSKCNTEKDLNSFYHWKRVCKSCHSLHGKKYRKENKEKVSQISKNWYYKTKASRRKHKSEYMKNRRKKDKIFHLKTSISRAIRVSFYREGYSKKSKTHEILGCSFEKFKLHLESKFEPWMNWDNYGKYNGELNYGWDIDHIISLSNATTEEDIIRLNHYTNLQPLCSKINRDIKRDL